MFEEQSIREQSIQLLKDQNNKLKIQNKELQLKDDQIKFLKETILVLEQEKDSLAHHNHTLKQKLKTMANQINNYNTNFVQKIYEENQNLNSTINQQLELIDKYKIQNSELVFKVKEMEKEIASKNKENIQINKNMEELKDWKSKTEKKLQLLQKQNKQLQTKNIGLQRQVDDGNNQITYFSQQIDILSQKHQQTVKGAEKKLKQTVQKMVGKEELTRVESQIKEALIKNKHLKSEIDKLHKENDKLRFQVASLKQKLLNFEIKEETQSLQLKLDLTNLSESIKIGKKVAQFQSQQHEIVSQIFNSWRDLRDKIQKYEQYQFAQQKKLKTTQSQLKAVIEHIKMLQEELSAQKQRHQKELQSLQASYENTVMELNLKLKKQQIVINNFKLKQDQLEKLRDENQNQRENSKQEREAIISTMEQLRKENSKLSSQLTMAVGLCQENIINRECISHYKYTLQELLAIVYYLYMILHNYKQKITNNYLPFIDYYYRANALQDKKKQKKKGINRFRICVWAVRCIIRMRTQGQLKSKRGLQRHAANAIQKRFKIENLSAHIENISNCILKGGKVQDILKFSSDIYKWKKQSFQRIALNMQSQKR